MLVVVGYMFHVPFTWVRLVVVVLQVYYELSSKQMKKVKAIRFDIILPTQLFGGVLYDGNYAIKS